ncbi:hypothetical protein SOVF_205040 [Spinacia oleracea]|nr:hypothetical protein SOVF_205040 [Spinacia oleracea]
MAYTRKSAFLPLATLVLLFLSTTSPPQANALLINGLNVNALAIIGTCHCSPTITSACNTCSLLSNILVSIKLNGNIIASAYTAHDGTFKINLLNVGNILTGLTDISNLRVVVSLPILGCPIWATVSTGHLEGIPILQAGSILNGVATCLVPSLNLVN